MRIVRFWRSTNDVLTCLGSGSPLTVFMSQPAVEFAFGADADYAMLHKLFGAAASDESRYGASGYSFIQSKVKDPKGNPLVIDIKGASNKLGTPLDAYTQKSTGYDNQLWQLVPA